MLESLRKKLRILNKTKEQWEETKTYIEVKVTTVILSSSMRCPLLTHLSTGLVTFQKVSCSQVHANTTPVYC